MFRETHIMPYRSRQHGSPAQRAMFMWAKPESQPRVQWNRSLVFTREDSNVDRYPKTSLPRDRRGVPFQRYKGRNNKAHTYYV
jgi:hypothetical protein